jgi:hypothetical protein
LAHERIQERLTFRHGQMTARVMASRGS